MYGLKKILVVVPARGGSKGIPLKNLYPVMGRPMIAYVSDVLAKLDWIDRAVVSTDSEEIASVAEAFGISAPFRRPSNLSGDYIGDVDVLIHALSTMESIDNCQYDVVIMLQPTSPLRRAEHVLAAMEMFSANNFDAVWTLSETDSKSHPYKQLALNNGEVQYFSQEGKSIIARQQLTPVFHRNGIAYVISRDCLLTKKTILGEKTGGLVLSENCVSIDNLWDIELVEHIMANSNSI